MIAIYARQSIEKENSISTDLQIAHCKNIISSADIKEYVDKGYSGSNIKRPAFEQLMSDIKDGAIEAVYCYRLDRISRNILDFANLQEFFKKHNCSFVSSSESFDTYSPMGRAMVNIVMVFAQLERETIAGRIKDSFYARAKMGAFVGGGIPFGYTNVKANFNGKQMSVLMPDENADIVQEIFNEYSGSRTSLKAIAAELNYKGIKTSTGKYFNAVGIRRILTNPVYAACTPDIYDFYFSQRYIIYNKIEDFTGDYGGLIIGKESGRHVKINPVNEQTFIIGAHKPLISAETFLAAQYRLSHNKALKRSGTSSLTWVTGLTKCAECGRAMTAVARKGYVYLICRGHSNLGNVVCRQAKHHRIKDIEIAIEERLLDYINTLEFNLSEPDINTDIERVKIDQQIEKLINDLALAEGTAASQHIINKINFLESNRTYKPPKRNIENVAQQIINTWATADNKTKNDLARAFIESVQIKSDEININWII